MHSYPPVGAVELTELPRKSYGKRSHIASIHTKNLESREAANRSLLLNSDWLEHFRGNFQEQLVVQSVKPASAASSATL